MKLEWVTIEKADNSLLTKKRLYRVCIALVRTILESCSLNRLIDTDAKNMQNLLTYMVTQLLLELKRIYPSDSEESSNEETYEGRGVARYIPCSKELLDLH